MIQIKVIVLMVMSFAFIFFQTAEGSSIMPGTEDPLTCEICDKDDYDKWLETHDSIQKNFNEQNHHDDDTWDVSKFDFDAPNTRKYPIWVNWIPASYNNTQIKLPMEYKMQNDKITSHGMSRNHHLFDELMNQQENDAKYFFDSAKIQNKYFSDKNNFFTIYLGQHDKRNDKELQHKLEIQETLAMETMAKLLYERNTRY